MKVLFDLYDKKASHKNQMHFCPGCGHGILHRMMAENIERLCGDDIENVVWVSGVGCCSMSDQYLNLRHVMAAHGRASAVATGIKRLAPESLVVVYQGDGDFASIGLAESLHAANRGENITVVFVNNANFGMTGGQMAPTTLIGQKTSTSPDGRTQAEHGDVMPVCEIIASLKGSAFVARCVLGDFRQLKTAQNYLLRALEKQKLGHGYAFVEVISPCPPNWHMTPTEAKIHAMDVIAKQFEPQIYKDTSCQIYEPRRLFDAYRAKELLLEKITRKNNLDFPLFAAHEREFRIKIIGIGGSGALTLGRDLCEKAQAEHRLASYFPNYGPEKRGGFVTVDIIVSKSRIEEISVNSPDIIIALEVENTVLRLEKGLRASAYVCDAACAETLKKHGAENIRVADFPNGKMLSENWRYIRCLADLIRDAFPDK